MIEQTILANLVLNEDYSRKVFPYIDVNYFGQEEERVAFRLIHQYITKYNRLPTKESLLIDLGEVPDVSDDMLGTTCELIEGFEDNKSDIDWLVDSTEKFCQDKALYNAVLDAVSIMDGSDSVHDKGAIPKILSDALAVTFDNSIGHDYLDDAEARFEFYHRLENKTAFDLEMFNKVTRGGIADKSLTIALAGTGVGKSLFMCHCAASNMIQGKNVLYITMEMAEERIAERIDSNALDVDINKLETIDKVSYNEKVSELRKKVLGKLIIKEYPATTAGAQDFRNLINELKIKKNFVPDIIYVDYLNICKSDRMRLGGTVNSYTYIKAIAEELRGLAAELGLPIVSATQINREGFNSNDVELTNISESFGLAHTADLMFALMSNEDLAKMGQFQVKLLKNRYNDLNYHKRFVIGIDKKKMRLYDVEIKTPEQNDLSNSGATKSPDRPKSSMDIFDTKTKPKQSRDWSKLN